MEIGSFIELELRKTQEYYREEHYPNTNIARLNCGRTAIWHAFRVLGGSSVWLPYYLCDCVRNYFIENNIQVKYYHIDDSFNPVDVDLQNDECMVLVNYFGVMSYSRMKALASKYHHVIIDNSQAFFAPPVENCMNVYSARKFVGVPDGSYVIGNHANQYCFEYPQGYSSDTSLFLLQRIEYGCEGKAYISRCSNEERLEHEGIKRMSVLTHSLLRSYDYGETKRKRRENFAVACELFNRINLLSPEDYYDESSVPMVYPLAIKKDNLLDELLKNKHFQGHWWRYLVDEMNSDSFEYFLSRYMVPITIDQRYNEKDLLAIKEIVHSVL